MIHIEKYNPELHAKLEEACPSTLFHSGAWIELQKQLPDREVGPIVYEETDGAVVGFTVLIIHSLPLSQKYAYINRGPVTSPHELKTIKKLTKSAYSWCKKQNYLFLRVAFPVCWSEQEPQKLDISELTPELPQFPSLGQNQPVHTIMIDLSKSEDEILAQMKSKGRYNIKVAKKHAVTVEKSTDIVTFYDLVRTTTHRNKFTGHSKEYYEKFIKNLGTLSSLYLAYYENKPIAGIITTTHGDTCTYYYGASSSKHRNVMAPFLLQWTAMREAKEHGYKWYDLFGVAPKDEPNHPWLGITQFKERFGGVRKEYFPTIDIPIHPLRYFLLRQLQVLRRKFR